MPYYFPYGPHAFYNHLYLNEKSVEVLKTRMVALMQCLSLSFILDKNLEYKNELQILHFNVLCS